MTNKQIILKLFILFLFAFLFFGFIFQQNCSFLKEQEDKSINIMLSNSSLSKSIVCEWNQTWGGIKQDTGYAITLDSSNNIYITGVTNTGSSIDILLVKYDSNGVLQWSRTWGGNEADCGWGIAVDSSNNIYIAGQTESFGAGSSDMLLVKYDGNGIFQWYRTWGDTAYEVGRAVAVDSSDDVYLAGGHDGYWTGADHMHLIKYNSSGVELWSRTWGGTEWDRGWGVAVDSSDNVYFTGDTESFGAGSSDMILVKYSSAGVQLWNRTWGGTDGEGSLGVALDSIDNVYLVGATHGFGAGGVDMVLVKYNSSGAQQWNRTWGGIDSDEGWSIAVDPSNNIYLGGQSNNFGVGSFDMIIVKYDNSGLQQWNRTWGGSDKEICWGVAVNSSNNVYLVGETMSFGAGSCDMVLVKYGPDIYKPIIRINQPSQNEKFFGDLAPDYDISIKEPNLNSIWYTIDGGLNNYTITQLSGTINQSAWDSSPYGLITLGFNAKDFVGNIGSSEVTVRKSEGPAIKGYDILTFTSLIEVMTAVFLIYLMKKSRRYHQ